MVRIDRTVTRGGDKGETSLGDGSRQAKHAPRIEALGAVDEANAALGLLMLHLDAAHGGLIAAIQNDLFDLGADLCKPGLDGKRLDDGPLLRYEATVAALNGQLPPLTSFILPGGTPAGAHCHMARTIVRRAERALCALAEAEPLNPLLVPTLNRLSDLLFVLGRVLNGNGARDVLWVPGQ
jgi:cob(I)alamin adenosyltransferase